MDRFNKYLIITAFTLVIFVTIGYAYLNTTLTINGSSKINNPTWNIHFENVQVTTGSVTANTPVINPNTTVTYSVNLSKPGDFYEFTVDAKNDGSIDAMIDTVLSTLNNTEIQTLPSYLNYSVSYSDGGQIQSNQELNAGTKETLKIRVEYKKDLTASDLPATNQTLNFSFTIIYKQKDSTSVPVPHPNFETDNWTTIINNVGSGNTNNYNVGDTKEVDLGSLGTHTIRIANKSTPAECSTTGFSQTACGFVLEFADIITSHRMNPYTSGVITSGNGNIGGWPLSEMRTYVNSDIYNALPSELKSGIINTTVVSGHGSSDSANFTSTDKLYLLSTHEVWEDVDGNTNSGIDYNDTAYNSTRQLDYYSSQNVTTSSYIGAIKQYNSWWLRSASSNYYSCFYNVDVHGDWSSHYGSSNAFGVSPAFRIG